jgi:hypothetical protein
MLRTVTNNRSFIFYRFGWASVFRRTGKFQRFVRILDFFFYFFKKILRTVTNNRSFLFFRIWWASEERKTKKPRFVSKYESWFNFFCFFFLIYERFTNNRSFLFFLGSGGLPKNENPKIRKNL